MPYTENGPERLFAEAGPMYHLYTSALEDCIILQNGEDRDVALNLLALSIMREDCRLLAYALMSNHFHFILEGEQSACLAFFELFRERMGNYLKRHGRRIPVDRIRPGLTIIENLKQFRDVVAYVIRNPFVARRDINPLADLWSSGYLYFNPLLRCDGIPASELNGRALRQFLHSRIDEHPDGRIRVRDGRAQPDSFVDYRRTMAFFEDARQFVMWTFKNVEGVVEVARKLGESVCLNDEEMLSLAYRICRNQFHAARISDLPLEDRKRLALLLHKQYLASNAQLARCTRLEKAEIDELFPLQAK